VKNRRDGGLRPKVGLSFGVSGRRATQLSTGMYQDERTYSVGLMRNSAHTFGANRQDRARWRRFTVRVWGSAGTGWVRMSLWPR
jgi:hypothetical protein